MPPLNDLTMAPNSAQDTSAEPPPSFMTLPSEIRQVVYENFFAPDLSTAQYFNQNKSLAWLQGRHGLRLGLLAVCKQIHAEAIGVLYKSSVFYFRMYVSDVKQYFRRETREAPGDGLTTKTIEVTHWGPKFDLQYAPLFCYRPQSHIHMIRNVHLIHPMEVHTYGFEDSETFALEMFLTLYLTIFRDTCPCLETLTIEYTCEGRWRNYHMNRFPRTLTYLREAKTLELNTSFLLEQLLPQLRQVRVVTVGHCNYDEAFLQSLQKMLLNRGAVHEVVEGNEGIPFVNDKITMDILTLTQQRPEDFSAET